MINNIGLPGLILILLVTLGIIGTIVALSRPTKPTPGAQHYDYAGFWIRACAMLLDTVVVSVVGFIAVIFIYVMLPGVPLGEALAISSQILIPWIYFASMESSGKQATLGKMALGIKVIDTEGRPISFGRATGRFFGKFISQVILMIGYFMAGWTQKKQALHDKMASTLVVRAERSMATISTTPAE